MSDRARPRKGARGKGVIGDTYQFPFQQIAKLENEFAAKSLDALNEADANYSLRAEEVKKAEDKARLTVLTSPIDGVVAQMKAPTIGPRN